MITPTQPVVLKMSEWPRGFCPVHYPAADLCVNWCLPARIQLAQVQIDYRDYWTEIGLLHGARRMMAVASE